MLELAVLGLLLESPMHGYQLRKALGERLCGSRAFSYGSLYPALRRLSRAGHIVEEAEVPPESGTTAWSRRSRKVYRLTAEGKERFATMLGDAGPQAWEDDGFGVHLAFFSRTPAESRMRIVGGRRRRVEEQRKEMGAALARGGGEIGRHN
ncbi:MAG: PadR family transcriptional regulator, partial [Pseudonocardia sp.]